jgi:sialidase-1
VNTTPIKTVVCPATPETPRMVEAALLPFDDGRLYLVYSAGARADHIDGGMPEGELRLMGKWSRDAGASWSEPFVVREYEGIPNAMEPSFLRLPSGRVLQEYMQRDTHRAGGDASEEIHPMITHSDDDCATWSEPSRITGDETQHISTNDRLVGLSGGRILLPVLTALDMTRICIWLSDDDGATWRAAKGDIPAIEGMRYGYPMAAELADGRVAMFLQNSSGQINVSHSDDGGDTWSTASATGPAPCPATFMVRRIQNSADLLLIWNNHPQRTNLTTAVSHDHGETWTNYRLLEGQDGWPVERTYAFPSLAFLGDAAHLTYYERRADERTGARFNLIYRRLPISWFYE